MAIDGYMPNWHYVQFDFFDIVFATNKPTVFAPPKIDQISENYGKKNFFRNHKSQTNTAKILEPSDGIFRLSVSVAVTKAIAS